jgi:hypothetical protein
MGSRLDVPTLDHVIGLVEAAQYSDAPYYQLRGTLARLKASVEDSNGQEQVTLKLEAPVLREVLRLNEPIPGVMLNPDASISAAVTGHEEAQAEHVRPVTRTEAHRVASHADAAAVAHRVGLTIPADVRAPWDDAATVSDKKKALLEMVDYQEHV